MIGIEATADIGVMNITCPLNKELRDYTYPVRQEGADIAIEAFRTQAEIAYEEIGDVLIGATDDLARQCVERAGATAITHIEAKGILKAVNKCLTLRYMGACTAAKTCIGKSQVDDIVSKLTCTDEDA